MAELKRHLSLADQVKRLQSRGLTIEDAKEAEQFLLNTNYYRLSGYLHDFKVEGTDTYQAGLTLDRVRRIYDFDRKLARIIMYALGDVEETLKSRLAYVISSSFPGDPLVYLKPTVYRDYNQYISFLQHFYKEKDNNAQLPFVKHHIENYGGMLPIWVAVELFTMGNLSALYKNFAAKYQKELAKIYGTGPVQLSNWIENLTYTRNHLAHYMRIYNFNFGRTPKLCRKHRDNQWTSHKIFDQLCIAAFMYSNSGEWNNYVVPEISKILAEYVDVIDLDAIGFPVEWEKILSVSSSCTETKESICLTV